MTAWEEAKRLMMRPGARPVSDRAQLLVDDVLQGLRVFNTLHGLNIPEALLLDRARNVVTALIANYKIEEL